MKKEVKTYTVTLYEEDGKQILHRTNDGFSGFELYGILEITKEEILQQMRGEIKPDIIKRNYVED